MGKITQAFDKLYNEHTAELTRTLYLGPSRSGLRRAHRQCLSDLIGK